MAVQQQLSGTIVVIIIAMAVQVCIMLVIVVKRQIMRFAIRNRRGPHTHIGQGAPKVLRRETDRQLEYVAYIRHEPKPYELESDGRNYRVLALKELRSLEEEIATYSASYLRPPCGNMRSFFLNCIHGPLLGVDTHRIHLLCDDYEHARHHYENFDEVKFKAFKSRIEEMREAIQRNRQRKPFPSPLPPSTSRQKKAKVRRKSEDKAAAASAAAATAGDRAATPATPDSKAAMLVTTTANFGETNSTPV